ncbi:hypothetical protein BGX38DRAFT_1191828 [Terfezia claveryi]|nr:hypothetical protein BGX38DRAFT_1191828 [Terfezia claveryi]
MKLIQPFVGLVASVLATHLLPTFAAPPPTFRPDIRVDSNRDGVADISPNSLDIHHKTTWTPTRGAIFIANIGHTLTPSSCPRPFKSLLCSNGYQDTALAPEYLAPIRTVPLSGPLPDGLTGEISVLGAAKAYTSIFYKDANGSWVLNTPDTVYITSQLQKGLELGIQGRNIVKDERLWNGTTTVRFSITDPSTNTTLSDSAVLKLAPILTHHHLQKAVRIFTLGGNDTIPDQALFAENLSKQVKDAGITEPVHLFQHSDDPWAQDFFEPGYTSFPGPGGKPIVLRTLIRSAQPTRASGGQLLGELAARDVGIIETSDGSRSEVNSMGNLETIPPYSHNGKSFPAGRLLIGDWADQKMAWGVIGMLKAQKVQDPLFIDTDWLRAGHVDEIFQFLPDNSQTSNATKSGFRNWRLAVASPAYALSLLRKAQEAGHGHAKLVSRDNSFGAYIPPYTISSFLAKSEHVEINEAAWKRIQANLQKLQDETGLKKEEITYLPVLYENDNSFNEGTFYWNYNVTKFYGGDFLSPIVKPVVPGKLKVGPVLPCAINGLLLSDTSVVVPKQWGPLVGGKDIFEEAVREEYKKLGIKAGFLDDWTTQHEGGGDVHCGTNSLREGGKWWL